VIQKSGFKTGLLTVLKLAPWERLFALRAHPFGAALWAFSADAALCSRLRRSSSASLRTAAATRQHTTWPMTAKLSNSACFMSGVRMGGVCERQSMSTSVQRTLIREAGFRHPGESFLHYPDKIPAVPCLSSTCDLD
jgi:hypothetical protein